MSIDLASLDLVSLDLWPKVRVVLLFLFCIAIRNGPAACAGTGDVFSDRLNTAIQSRNLSQTQAIVYEAMRVVDPSGLPGDLASAAAAAPVKCAFGTAVAVRHHWSRFEPEQRAQTAAMALRPELPNALVSPSGRFKIHYAMSGQNGVPPGDDDRNGLPDYAEKAAVIFDSVYSVEVETLNFKTPPQDDVDGPEWDVYVRNIPGSYGWTNPDAQVSSNPDRYTSYIEVDNNYTSTPTKGLDGLRTTAAHEFFHVIQLGYNARDENNDGSYDDQFMMEASCTWMEDEVFTRINDYYYYLPEYFNENGVAFDRMDGWREYGLCLWFHFLDKRFGGTEIVRSVWEEIVSVPALTACDRVLVKRGSSFAGELPLYYAWNVMTGSRADTVLFYPEGGAYPEIKPDCDARFLLDTTLASEALPTASRVFRFKKEDGSFFFLVPTNVDWLTRNGDRRFIIALVSRDGTPAYTDLGNGTSARMVSNGYLTFQCTAALFQPGVKAELKAFRAQRSEQDESDLPECFPNPFIPKNHGGVTIPFILGRPDRIWIRIFDSSGMPVKTEEKYILTSGTQYVQWNGRNDKNEPASGGIYVFVVSTEAGTLKTGKIALVR
jgi:hypothetical protein